MRERTLQILVAVFFIVLHIGIASITFVAYGMDGLLYDQMTTTLAIVTPMFAGYLSIIVRFALKTKDGKPATDKRVSSFFAFTTLTMIAFFALAIIVMIILKAYNKVFGSFDEFKQLLLVADGLFAVYVGQLMGSLFAKVGAEAPKKRAAKAAAQ